MKDVMYRYTLNATYFFSFSFSFSLSSSASFSSTRFTQGFSALPPDVGL
jgi:hypothetical protein